MIIQAKERSIFLVYLPLPASLELEVDLLSIFDSFQRADGGLLKKNSVIESSFLCC